MIFRLFLILALLTGGGCTPLHRHDRDLDRAGLHVVSGVPFRAQQSRDDCGPAALISLMAHRGKEVPLENVTSRVHNPALGGTLLPDMENFARLQGFATRSGRGDMELLRLQIDAGRPVAIPVEMGVWLLSRPHYLVVFGYDEGRFLVHAGLQEKLFIEAGELLSRWEKMNRLYLYLE